MFAREYRLPSSVTFSSGAATIRTPFFMLKTVSNTLSHNRYGFVISKRVDKRAVERNRLRRLFSSVFETVILKQGFDILVIVSPQSREKERDVIQSPLEDALKKAGLKDEV